MPFLKPCNYYMVFFIPPPKDDSSVTVMYINFNKIRHLRKMSGNVISGIPFAIETAVQEITRKKKNKEEVLSHEKVRIFVGGVRSRLGDLFRGSVSLVQEAVHERTRQTRHSERGVFQ